MESTEPETLSSVIPATRFLTNLPSRGLLTSPVVSSNIGGARLYVCDHNTDAPEDQLIRTNQTNILIRSLKLSSSGKRTLDKTSGARPAKRVASSSGKDLWNLTVEKLRQMSRERGLSTKGKKNELIARLGQGTDREV